MAQKITVSGRMIALDEETFSANESRSRPFNWSTTLSEDDEVMEDDFERIVRAGGEVRGEMNLLVQLRNKGRVRVNIDLNLFEGTSESTSDLDGSRSFAFTIPNNHTVSRDYIVYNESENAGDFVKVTMTCRNLEI
jgi:hypothetical protein